MEYRFKRYGTLCSRKGVRGYEHIPGAVWNFSLHSWQLVWWWPVNWLAMVGHLFSPFFWLKDGIK